VKNDEVMKILKRIEAQLESQSPKPLTMAEAAQYLGISMTYLYRITSRGQIPHFKPGGKKNYFLKSDLDNWLLRNRVRSIDELDELTQSSKEPVVRGRQLLDRTPSRSSPTGASR
jgi:excisionase family DNA binding protein